MQENGKTFIEAQFPVSLISKESYKERKAGAGQTLTGLGKWWGRKPLILVRASILGMLMPASHNPQKDREIFLQILTMDNDGLWQRRSKSIPAKIIYETLPEFAVFFEETIKGGVRFIKGLDVEKKDEITRAYFDSLSYDDKLEFCDRPEQIDGPTPKAWIDINAHLGTTANNIQELIDQLGKARFGHTPKVGDAFCGGGSIPFEAARIGCEVYGSDLNPVAALLTWASIHIIGGGKDAQKKVQAAQESVFLSADKQITEWGIEHNEQGWRADAYLYCVEAICPATGYLLPLAPNWIISEKYNVCAVLKVDKDNKRYNIEVVNNADKETMENAKIGTIKDSRMVCPETGETFSMSSIRKDKSIDGKTIYGLRNWENEDLVPLKTDIFQERLYCVRWIETYWGLNSSGGEIEKTRRHYCPVTAGDLNREKLTLELLKHYFIDWQNKGYIPSRKIERGGEKTEELIRTRGWSHWHHLFLPRHLLTLGLIGKLSESLNELNSLAMFIWIAKATECYSRIMSWNGARDGTSHVFTDQALNTFYSIGSKSFQSVKIIPFINTFYQIQVKNQILTKDARDIDWSCDLWITDPPYADAICYHELTEFFLTWYGKKLHKIFPSWSISTRSALAVKGKAKDFKLSMVEIYSNLAKQMPDNGLQMVQFTHQDSAVWGDLGMILWVAGLHVSSAWTIATEATSGLKKGNYVQGTVLLVLRKRINHDEIFRDELPDMIEDEVKQQLDDMLALDDQEMPNFGDTDYQLAAYAAALRVMTQYSTIEGINIENELYREKQGNQITEFQKLIDQAVEIACNHLIPKGFDEFHWKGLAASERLYLKGLELEKHGELRLGAYQELSKGFGVREYSFMFARTTANEVRFKTGTEFKRTNLGGDNFASSLMRHILFALHETVTKENAREGVNYLKVEVSDFWGNRKKIIEILRYLNRLSHIDHMTHWEVDAEAAQTLAGALENVNA
jgi:putative DNA methylase